MSRPLRMEWEGGFYPITARGNEKGPIFWQSGHPLHPGTQVAMYLTRKKTDLSLKEIGAFFGERYCTAVSVACRRVEARRQRDLRLDRELRKTERDTC